MNYLRSMKISILFLTFLLIQHSLFPISGIHDTEQFSLQWENLTSPKPKISVTESLDLLFPSVYHNLSELYTELSHFNDSFPDLIDYTSIGLSYENNTIPLIVLTNENIEESLKGKTYWVAHHHAREQISIEHTIRTIRDLVNGYNTLDQNIGKLLDQTIIYFIVTLNPDSLDYVLYNDPWQRKNMRPIDDDNDGTFDEDGPNDVDNDGYVSIYSAAYEGGGWELWYEGNDEDNDGEIDEDSGGGVDLNRNYPIHWNDNSCDSGCTSNTLDEDYQGISPLSEKETKALVDFVIQHNFTHATSLHSGTTIPLLGWGYTNEKQPEESLYQEMLSYWEAGNLLPVEFFDPTNTDVDYTVAGGWSDWSYITQNTISLTLEIYESTGSNDWRFFNYNGTHNIYESDVVFFDPPEYEIENVHRNLYEFEEEWLSLTPTIEVEKTKFIKSNGEHRVDIYLKSGSRFFNTTDNAKVKVEASADIISDYPESIGTLFPTESTILSISFSEGIPDEFTLNVNVTSQYASDLQLGISVTASTFRSTPGFNSILTLATILFLLPIVKKKKL